MRQSAAWKTASNLPFIRHFSFNLGLTCIILGLSVLSNGFDQSLYNQIQAMPAFKQTFGRDCNPESGVCALTTSQLSILNSVPYIGFGFSLLIAAPIGEKFGRRIVYIIMNCICLIGVGITYSSKSYPQIVLGRCVVQVYTGFEAWLIPMFMAELVPSNVRGGVMSSYIFGRLIGTLIVSCIGNHTAKWSGNESWKTPVEVMFAIPSLALLLCWIIPESPRWLLRKGEDEKAFKSLQYINGDRSEAETQSEIVLLKESLALDKEKGSWLELFQGTNRRRTTIAMITNFVALATGQSFAAVYQTVFLATLGTINPFLFNILSSVAGICGAAMFALLVDKAGRRRWWQTTGPMAAVCMFCLGGLGLIKDPTTAQKNAIAAFFPIFGFFFMSSFAQLGAITPAEISSLRLRDKTVTAGWTVQNLTNFVATFTTPYLMNPGYGNLHSKIGFIHGSIAIVGCLWAFFYYPELKGRSLEEIDEMMRQNIPARKTRNWEVPENSIGHMLTQLEAHTGMESVGNDLEKNTGRSVHVENSIGA